MFKRALYFSMMISVIAVPVACSVNKDKKIEKNEKPIAVILSPVSGVTPPSVLASGALEAAQTANISTKVMGRITHIYVKTGDRVARGQLIASVWDDDIKAKRAQADAMIAEAEGAYATAQKDYDRFNNLYEQQSATAKELDNATMQYNSAKAKLAAVKQIRNEVNANLSYSSLTAPFSGVVTQKLAEVGSIANPGMPLFTIEQNGMLQVSASIAESDISHVHSGDICHVQIKSTGLQFEGKIIQVNPSSQFTGGQYIVKISIPENAKKDIYSGMFASISIPVKGIGQLNSDAILVPSSSIINRDELTGIYTVSENSTALLRWVRLGKSYGNEVEVISGLSKDEKFILSSEGKLYNGVPVDVKQIPEISMATIKD